MANKSAAKKYIKQSEKRRVANKSVRTFIKTCSKKVDAAIEAQDKDASFLAFKFFEKNIMKAVSKGVFHLNTAARLVSRKYSLYKRSFSA